ncbi:MAG: hypothetical protein V4507_17105 [Verrucomicrobiota bacterium]
MAQIDVVTHWRSPQSDRPLPVRLRIVQDQEKTLALLSAPPNTLAEEIEILNHQLDHEFQHAATSVSILFALKPLETVWLRELFIDGKAHVRRVIMDEKNGELINPRSGTLTPWESSVSKNIDRYFNRSRKKKEWSWVGVGSVILVLGILLQGGILYQTRRNLFSSRSEVQKLKKQLEEMSQKVLLIDLIEKERQYASGPQSTLKRIYRQSTNSVVVPVPIYKKTEPLSKEKVVREKSWVEGWNEQIFPKTEKVDPPEKQ